jgi:hypothetical protein
MMANLLPTYEYQDDMILAVFENQVIAKGTDFAKVAETAVEYLDGLSSSRKKEAREVARKSATHITTPNGARGEIISRVTGLWGDEVTVRFENNQIRRFATAAASEEYKYSTEASKVPDGPKDHFQAILSEQYVTSRAGLTERLTALEGVRNGAGRLAARESSIPESRALHQFVLAAEAETAEIKDVLAHLEDVDAQNAAPAPPVYAAVEQAGMGRAANDSWLDVIAAEMITESESYDYDKLLADGPTQLVSALDDSAVHNAGTIREIAQSDIMGKTAGFQGEKIEAYREAYVASAETARRRELTYRQDNKRKEATVKEASIADTPDDILFL